MAKYTKQEINSVAQTDMVNFLSSEYGFHFYRKGNGFSCDEHSSLFIRANRQLWFWNSKGIGGKGVFDWMLKVEGQDFKSVMNKFLGTEFVPAVIQDKEEHTYDDNSNVYFDENKIPQKNNGRYTNAFAYLTKTRNISAAIVSELMKQHRIYQDTRKNAVFTNLNENGEIGFWCLRGTNTEKKFTRNMPGSNNPYYGFAIDAKIQCDTLYVFEAPIDLLSHCTIADLKYGTGNWHNQHRIALCGVNDTALRHYLSYHKNITTIKFCLDNDDAGKNATQTLMAKYYKLGYKTQSINYKNSPGKDINEILCNYINKTNQKISTPPRKAEEKQTGEKTTSEEKIPEEKAQAAPSKSNYDYDRIYMGVY